MKTVLTVLAVSLVLFSAPAAAKTRLIHKEAHASTPRAVKTFMIAERRVEMLAVTRKARADTPLRRAHLSDCENMAKVFPGYPQPAFVSVDFRVRF